MNIQTAWEKLFLPIEGFNLLDNGEIYPLTQKLEAFTTARNHVQGVLASTQELIAVNAQRDKDLTTLEKEIGELERALELTPKNRQVEREGLVSKLAIKRYQYNMLLQNSLSTNSYVKERLEQIGLVQDFLAEKYEKLSYWITDQKTFKLVRH